MVYIALGSVNYISGVEPYSLLAFLSWSDPIHSSSSVLFWSAQTRLTAPFWEGHRLVERPVIRCRRSRLPSGSDRGKSESHKPDWLCIPLNL